MTARVPASDRTRKQIADVLSGDFDKSALLRHAVRLIIEEALGAEVTGVLGRGHHERGEPAGYRNGNRLGRLKAAEGIVEYAVPQVTGTAELWASEVKQALSGHTEELEQLVVEMRARGLSMRGIEAAFTGADGRCVLTKSATSQVTERLWEDDWAFAGRDLAGQPILYLFLDGVAEQLHLGQPRDPVLVATDGAPGPVRAVEEVFPQSLRQRCLAHKLRNPGAKVPEERWREVKAHALAAYQALSPLAARAAAEDFRRRYAPEFPGAVARFEDDFEARIAHLRLPSPIARRFGPRICWSGCSVRSAAGPKPSPTPSANGRC